MHLAEHTNPKYKPDIFVNIIINGLPNNIKLYVKF